MNKTRKFGYYLMFFCLLGAILGGSTFQIRRDSDVKLGRIFVTSRKVIIDHYMISSNNPTDGHYQFKYAPGIVRSDETLVFDSKSPYNKSTYASGTAARLNPFLTASQLEVLDAGSPAVWKRVTSDHRPQPQVGWDFTTRSSQESPFTVNTLPKVTANSQ